MAWQTLRKYCSNDFSTWHLLKT